MGILLMRSCATIGVLLLLVGLTEARTCPSFCSNIDNDDRHSPRLNAIESLIHQLKNGTKPEKLRAAHRLGELRAKDASLVLMEELASQESDFVSEVVWALGEISDPSTLEAIRLTEARWEKLFLQGEEYNRSCLPSIVIALEKLKTTDVQIRLLRQGNIKERIKAARFLAKKKVLKAVVPLTECLKVDSNCLVRCWIAYALAEIGDFSAVGPLIDAMRKSYNIGKTDILGYDSKCMTDYCLALEKLTGRKFGLEVEKWEKWWASHLLQS